MDKTICGAALYLVEATPETRWCFILLSAADGLTGHGEATLQRQESALLERAGSELARVVGQEVEPTLADRVEGRDDLPGAAVSSALSQALWDLAAQRADKPMRDLFCNAPAPRVPVYANINRRTRVRSPAAFAASAQAAISSGHTAVKIAPFDGVSSDNGEKENAALLAEGYERIAAVREAIGLGRRLMVDCHWRLSPRLAQQVVSAVASYGIHWLEAPLPETRENIPSIRRIRHLAHDSGFLLAGCELCVGVEGFEPYLTGDAYDVVMPDIKYIGSITEMIRLARRLEQTGVMFSPHNPSGPVAHAASLQICSTVGTTLLEIQFDETPLFGELAGSVPEVEAGHSLLPQGPGLGTVLNRELMSRHAVRVIEHGAPW